jgi:hypothetical protein
MSGGMGFYASAAPAAAARAAGGGAGAGRAVMPRSSGVTRARVPVPPPRDQGLRTAVTWPLRTFLELGAFPGAVPSARLHAKALAWEWGVACGDAVELVVSGNRHQRDSGIRRLAAAWGGPVVAVVR